MCPPAEGSSGLSFAVRLGYLVQPQRARAASRDVAAALLYNIFISCPSSHHHAPCTGALTLLSRIRCVLSYLVPPYIVQLHY